jgi:transposase-like protein
MARGRIFSREFKLEVCRQIASGEKRPAQVCREHALTDSLLYRWPQEYAARGEAAFTPREAGSAKSLERRVAELEHFCGQLALENAALKRGLSARASRSGTP